MQWHLITFFPFVFDIWTLKDATNNGLTGVIFRSNENTYAFTLRISWDGVKTNWEINVAKNIFISAKANFHPMQD